MSPFKSSLARSVGKLLGVYKETDLSLRGTTQTSRKPPEFSATGGIIITSGSDIFHVFIGASEQSFSGTLDKTCEIICVAGGGSGGYFYGRGGGAGGIVHSPNFPLEGGVTYKVSAGDGGDGRASSVGFGNQGSDSYFKPSPASAAPSATNLYAMGGGGGGYSGDPTIPAPIIASTGSGGGTTPPGTFNPSFPSTTQHPTATKYSNAGGLGGSSAIGGSGGGAGGAGTGTPSIGGAGQPFSNFPAPIIAPAIPAPIRPTWTPAVGPTGLFGGGGAAYGTPGSKPGGSGGGGGWFDPTSDGDHNAVDYTGGGGGGPNPGPGAGGEGIVIVHYTV